MLFQDYNHGAIQTLDFLFSQFVDKKYTSLADFT